MDNKPREFSDKQSCFLEMFMRHQRHIYNYILSLCPNYSQADDILQEATKVMWEKFEDLNDQAYFLGWACKIARFKILAHRRKKTAGLWLTDEMMDQIQMETEKSNKNSSKKLEALQECLLKLSEKEQELILLRYEQNNSFPAISKILNRSVNGLYNTAAKIHQKLRLCIIQTLKQWEVT